MKHSGRAGRGLWIGVAVVTLTLALAGPSYASYKTTIDGISVSYSRDGATAYYDADDGMLTIQITESGGNLKVTVGPDANAIWGNYVDVYIDAPAAMINSISIKGADDCMPFIVGHVDYVAKFTLTGGVVGNTDFYGRDFGLGMNPTYMPVSISLKYSYTTAQLLGYSNFSSNAVPLATVNAPSSKDKKVGKSPPAAPVPAGGKSLFRKP